MSIFLFFLAHLSFDLDSRTLLGEDNKLNARRLDAFWHKFAGKIATS